MPSQYEVSEDSSTEEAETASRRGHRFYVAFTDTFFTPYDFYETIYLNA